MSYMVCKLMMLVNQKRNNYGMCFIRNENGSKSNGIAIAFDLKKPMEIFSIKYFMHFFS